MTHSKATFGVCAACAVVFLPTQAAHSQQAPQSAEASTVEEIIVTARKRQESLMKVPVIASGITEEQLQLFQAKDLKDIAAQVPGLTLGDSVLAVGTQVSLRGVSTSALDPGVDASVALVIDGLQLSQGLAYSSGMFDVAQVEVMKGPQSLFYGKSSPGGVIALRTADPTDQFEVIARAGYEYEAEEVRTELIVSGPVSDSLKLRLAGAYSDQEGFYRNIATGIPALGGRDPAESHVSPVESYMVRATALFEPSSAFDARLKIAHVRDDIPYAGTKHQTFCRDGLRPVNGLLWVNPNDGCKADRRVSLVDLDPAAYPGVPNNGTPFVLTEQTYGSLEMNFNLTPGLTLTSMTGYYDSDTDTLLNAAMTSAGGTLVAVVNDFERTQFTEELRLTSDFSGPFNFTLGAYYEDGEFSNLQTTIGNATLGLPPRLQVGQKTVDIETHSVFGQVLYQILPNLEIAAGARWTNEKRSIVGTNLITGTPQFVPLAVPEIEADNIAPELTLTYSATDDLTLFGALKRGYKSGSFNVATAPTPNENNAFGDEKVEGGELGMKARLFDRRMAFNLAGYFYEYTGLQVGANLPSPGGLTITRTVNAGSAEVYGIEADFTYSPASIAGLGLRAALNWNHGRYKELENVPCFGGQTIAEGCNQLYSAGQNNGLGGFTAQSRSGDPMFRAPDWQATFGFDYSMTIGNDLTLVFANNNQYSSKYVTNLGYLYYQDAYFKVDASVTLRGARDRWEVALVGKNLNNELTTGTCSNSNNEGNLLTTTQMTGTNLSGPAGIDEIGCYMDRGRELWVRVSWWPFR